MQRYDLKEHLVETVFDPGSADPHEAPEPQVEGTGASAATDPMLEALLYLCRHHGVERSPASLLNGMNFEGAMTATQAVELLRKAGFSATLVRRPPSKILSLLMPVVLLLRNGDACIVTRRVGTRSKRAGGARYEVVMPGADNEICTATEEELLPEYSGYALVAALKPGMRPAPEVGEHLDRHRPHLPVEQLGQRLGTLRGAFIGSRRCQPTARQERRRPELAIRLVRHGLRRQERHRQFARLQPDGDAVHAGPLLNRHANL